MDTNKKTRDYISAFVDDELPDADIELALASLREADGRQAWDLYHRIGDALRAEPAPVPDPSPGFAERLSAKLALEPIPLRRGAARPVTPTEALAALAPSVAAGAEALNGSQHGVQPASPHDGPMPEVSPAAAKRL